MRNIARITAILLIAISFTAVSAQHERREGPRGKKGFNIDRLTKGLELTEIQAKQIQQIHYEIQKSEIDMKSAMEKNRLEINNMVANNNIVDSDILNLTTNNGALMTEMKANKIQLWLDVYKILNADQQLKWTKFFQKMGNSRERARKGRGRQQSIREHNPDKQEREL